MSIESIDPGTPTHGGVEVRRAGQPDGRHNGGGHPDPVLLSNTPATRSSPNDETQGLTGVSKDSDVIH